jgi:tripartite-type tricarboxylate transporter receptor subunit TctC
MLQGNSGRQQQDDSRPEILQEALRQRENTDMPHRQTDRPRRLDIGRRMLFALAFGGAVLASNPAAAQSDYPNKPIHFIVGFAPGGPSDIISRVIGAKMGEFLGQQVVVENRTGGGGTVSTDYVARSEPDGYTILNTTTANPANETLSKSLQSRFGKDLVAVAPLADTANILVVHPSLGVKTLPEFIALAKKQPGLLYATAGVGSATHLTSELFNTMAGVKTMPVHYRGGGDALKDLLSGQVKMMFSSIAPVIGAVEQGTLVGIATTGLKRDPALPNLPTVAEAGVPGFETRLWIGITVRAGTPKPIIDKLAAAATKAAQDPTVVATLAKQGFEPLIMSPEQFAAYYIAERDKWGKVIKDTGMDQN